MQTLEPNFHRHVRELFDHSSGSDSQFHVDNLCRDLVNRSMSLKDLMLMIIYYYRSSSFPRNFVLLFKKLLSCNPSLISPFIAEFVLSLCGSDEEITRIRGFMIAASLELTELFPTLSSDVLLLVGYGCQTIFSHLSLLDIQRFSSYRFFHVILSGWFASSVNSCSVGFHAFLVRVFHLSSSSNVVQGADLVAVVRGITAFSTLVCFSAQNEDSLLRTCSIIDNEISSIHASDNPLVREIHDAIRSALVWNSSIMSCISEMIVSSYYDISVYLRLNEDFGATFFSICRSTPLIHLGTRLKFSNMELFKRICDDHAPMLSEKESGTNSHSPTLSPLDPAPYNNPYVIPRRNQISENSSSSGSEEESSDDIIPPSEPVYMSLAEITRPIVISDRSRAKLATETRRKKQQDENDRNSRILREKYSLLGEITSTLNDNLISVILSFVSSSADFLSLSTLNKHWWLQSTAPSIWAPLLRGNYLFLPVLPASICAQANLRKSWLPLLSIKIQEKYQYVLKHDRSVLKFLLRFNGFTSRAYESFTSLEKKEFDAILFKLTSDMNRYLRSYENGSDEGHNAGSSYSPAYLEYFSSSLSIEALRSPSVILRDHPVFLDTQVFYSLSSISNPLKPQSSKQKKPNSKLVASKLMDLLSVDVDYLLYLERLLKSFNQSEIFSSLESSSLLNSNTPLQSGTYRCMCTQEGIEGIWLRELGSRWEKDFLLHRIKWVRDRNLCSPFTNALEHGLSSSDTISDLTGAMAQPSSTDALFEIEDSLSRSSNDTLDDSLALDEQVSLPPLPSVPYLTHSDQFPGSANLRSSELAFVKESEFLLTPPCYVDPFFIFSQKAHAHLRAMHLTLRSFLAAQARKAIRGIVQSKRFSTARFMDYHNEMYKFMKLGWSPSMVGKVSVKRSKKRARSVEEKLDAKVTGKWINWTDFTRFRQFLRTPSPLKKYPFARYYVCDVCNCFEVLSSYDELRKHLKEFHKLPEEKKK